MLISQQTAYGADDPEWIKTAFKKENPNQALKGRPLPRRHASHDVQVVGMYDPIGHFVYFESHGGFSNEGE